MVTGSPITTENGNTITISLVFEVPNGEHPVSPPFMNVECYIGSICTV